MPAGAAATSVVLNLTAVNPTLATHLTVWPSGQAKPLVSNINVAGGETRANLVTVKLPADGKVKVANNTGYVDVVMDIEGYYFTGTSNDKHLYHPMVPARAVDTRTGEGLGFISPLGSGAIVTPKIAGTHAVPFDAESVVVNLTAVSPSAASHFTVYPAGGPPPTASNLNFAAGRTTSNLAIVRLGNGGAINIYNNTGKVDVVVDIVGWYGHNGALGFKSLAPTRVLDTRIGQGAPKARVAAGTSISVALQGVAGVPTTGWVAPVFNLTGVAPSVATHLTTGPAGVPVSATSNLNLAAGQTAANQVYGRTGASGADLGRSYIYNNAGSVDVVADVFGYFTDDVIVGSV